MEDSLNSWTASFFIIASQMALSDANDTTILCIAQWEFQELYQSTLAAWSTTRVWITSYNHHNM